MKRPDHDEYSAFRVTSDSRLNIIIALSAIVIGGILLAIARGG